MAKGPGLFLRLVVLVVFLGSLAACGGASGEGNEEGEGTSSGDPSGGEETGEVSSASSGGVEDMNVREMVGQMFVVSAQGTEREYYIDKMIRERNIGGVLLFGYNMESEEQVRSFAESMQTLSMETEPAIPMFVAVDQEGGEVGSAPWVSPQPAAAEVGARGDPAEARAIAEQIGTELLRAGVNTDFAPVVDTGFGGAIGSRSYGEDPALVSRMGVASIRGFESAGIVSSAKHFPNHGPATSDSHVSLPVIEHDMATINSYDLPPFSAAIEAGVPMVMVGHLVYPAIDAENPASLSPEAYSMLREDLGFEGVAVTDDLVMEGATGGGPPADAVVRAVEAGADLLILSSPPQEQADAYDAVVEAVESGEISEERIRASVERILEVKERYSLYEVSEG
jgi:beta-N-acetylhexosaminidase